MALIQTSLFENSRYPDAVGFRDTDTSKAAADSIDAATLRALVMGLMVKGYLVTADEAAKMLKIDRLSIRPRFSELKKQGLVRDTGQRHPNDSGKKAIVWARNA